MSRRRRADGFSIVEALVAAALAGIALASLSTVAALARRSLVRARDTSVALALATERLETLRIGPRADGSDVQVAAGGTRFVREWTIAEGRGGPTEMRVEVSWRDRVLAVATEVPP
jgi:type II secretory pathway pseudopilin PulG